MGIRCNYVLNENIEIYEKLEGNRGSLSTYTNTNRSNLTVLEKLILTLTFRASSAHNVKRL